MFVVPRDMKYDLAKQDPEVSEQESTKWVDKSLRALTRPVHKSFSGFVLSLYYISYLHMISKMDKKVKPEMGKSNVISTMYEDRISENFNQKNAKKWLCLWISRQKQSAVILCGKSNVKLQIVEIYFGILIIYQWDCHKKNSIRKWDLVALYVQNLLQKYDESTFCGGLHTMSTCCTCAKIMWHFEYMCCTILVGHLECSTDVELVLTWFRLLF